MRHRAAFFRGHPFILGHGGFADRAPEFQKVIEVPLQFFHSAADACRAGDRAHACGQIKLLHGSTKFLTLFALNAAAHTASARVVGHQDQIAARKADKGRKCRALVAALFFFDLNDELLPFGEGFTDRGRANIHAFLKVAAGNFLKGEEPVAFFAVVNEAGFKRGLDAGNDAFVDVGFTLFAACAFDVDVD